MDWKEVDKAVSEQGGQVERTRGNERRYVIHGQVVIGSGTPGDQRSIRNAIARLRAAGLIWPWSGRQRRAMRREKRQ